MRKAFRIAELNAAFFGRPKINGAACKSAIRMDSWIAELHSALFGPD